MFLEHPELIAGRLVFMPMSLLDCIVMNGPEHYSKSIGYSSSTRIDIEGECTNIRDPNGKILKEIVAIDALKFSDDFSYQFRHEKIKRELVKAYCGFVATYSEGKSLATGHWGCGAFNGDKDLKCVIQLIAASAAGYKHMLYTNMNDPEFEKRFNTFMKTLAKAKLSVGELFDTLLKCSGSNVSSKKSNNTYLLDFMNKYVESVCLTK